MSKKLSMLIVSMFMLFIHSSAQALKPVAYPCEAAVLRVPEQKDVQWKEVSRYVTKKEALVTRIPGDQSVEDLKNLICVQFYD